MKFVHKRQTNNKVNTDLGNGLAPTWLRDINCTNADQYVWCHIAQLGHNELTIESCQFGMNPSKYFTNVASSHWLRPRSDTVGCHCNVVQYDMILHTILQRLKQNINQEFNSLAPGRSQFNFRKVIFKLTLVNGGWGISYEIALRWMPQDLTDDKWTLVQVMAYCRQATSRYLS